MLKTILLLCIIGLSAVAAKPKQSEPRDLLCTICVDVITDLDEFLVSGPTEQQIVEFVEQVEIIYLKILE